MNIRLFEEIVLAPNIINGMRKKKKDDFNLAKFLGVNIDQSQSIRFGKHFEEIVKNTIKASPNTKLEKDNLFYLFKNDDKNSKSNKGKKDVDIFFQKDDKYYYFELKTNMNLDSEKSKATDEKIKNVTNFFQNKYNKKIISGCLTCWYENEKGLVNKLKSDIYYMKDLFKLLGEDIPTKEEYYNAFKTLGQIIK